MLGNCIRRTSRWSLFCSILILLPAGCSRRPKDERVDIKSPLLAQATADEKNFSTYQPAKPFVAAGDMLSRTVFQADAAAGYHIDVLDWNVPAGKTTDGKALAGAAFIEVRSGSGSLQTGESKRDVQLGAIVSISQGQSFTIANTGSLPLNLRVYLAEAR